MTNSTKARVGNGIKYFISAALIISGALKIIGVEAYQSMIMELSPNYYSQIYLLGMIAVVSGVLFAIPRTFTLGFIAVLVFLGGTISAHMSHGDNYIPQLIFVLLTSLSAFLLKGQWFENRKPVMD